MTKTQSMSSTVISKSKMKIKLYEWLYNMMLMYKILIDKNERCQLGFKKCVCSSSITQECNELVIEFWIWSFK